MRIPVYSVFGHVDRRIPGTVATVGISIALTVSISNSPNLQGYHDRMAQAVVATTR
ncbi:MAG: hypothetical protein WBF80_00185 [Rhodococcus sp. (in: high G+C Gram-positive bacteria)]|uniref:hypothetical protein n=1 Tax=Rhodococcus sp. SBT000017 TaxID=1803385 RepID=UPI000A9F775E|nr:hypothetical protein [Rhodococcus sp. SBT000017]